MKSSGRVISIFAVIFILVCNTYGEPPATCKKCLQDISCKPPDCYCCRDELNLPNIALSQIPQIVFFTFDDAVTGQVSGFYRDLFDSSRKNPNGCPISMTLFISHENTEYGLVSDFYNRGMEIASHSVTHSKMNGSNFVEEAKSQKENLAKLANIPLHEITGWRSPFLIPAGDLQPDALKKLGYTYDATLTFSKRSLHERPPGPFTLDFGYPYECQVKPCPKRRHPGFWEVPIVSLMDFKQKYDCVYVDGCMNAPPDEDSAYTFLWDNFYNYYTSTKMPFGINMHPSWFYYPDRLKAMDRFIKKLVSLNDVYIVSANKMLEWLKQPSPLQDLHSFAPWGCNGHGHNVNSGTARLVRTNLPPPPVSWKPRLVTIPGDGFKTRASTRSSMYTPAPYTSQGIRFSQTPTNFFKPTVFTQSMLEPSQHNVLFTPNSNETINPKTQTLNQEFAPTEITPINLELTQQRIQEEIRRLHNEQRSRPRTHIQIPASDRIRNIQHTRLTQPPSFIPFTHQYDDRNQSKFMPSPIQTRQNDIRHETRVPPITRARQTNEMQHHAQTVTPSSFQTKSQNQERQHSLIPFSIQTWPQPDQRHTTEVQTERQISQNQRRKQTLVPSIFPTQEQRHNTLQPLQTKAVQLKESQSGKQTLAQSTFQTQLQNVERQQTRLPFTIQTRPQTSDGLNTLIPSVTRTPTIKETQQTKHEVSPSTIQAQPQNQERQQTPVSSGTSDRHKATQQRKLTVAPTFSPTFAQSSTLLRQMTPTANSASDTITHNLFKASRVQLIPTLHMAPSKQEMMDRHQERLRQHYLLEMREREKERLHQEQHAKFMEQQRQKELNNHEEQRRDQTTNQVGQRRQVLWRPEITTHDRGNQQSSGDHGTTHASRDRGVSQSHDGGVSRSFRDRGASDIITSGGNIERFNKRVISTDRNNFRDPMGIRHISVNVPFSDNAPFPANSPFMYTEPSGNEWNSNFRSEFRPSFNTRTFSRGGSNRRSSFQPSTSRSSESQNPHLLQEDQIRRQQLNVMHNTQLANTRRLNNFSTRGQSSRRQDQHANGFSRTPSLRPNVQRQTSWNSFVRNVLRRT